MLYMSVYVIYECICYIYVYMLYMSVYVIYECICYIYVYMLYMLVSGLCVFTAHCFIQYKYFDFVYNNDIWF